MKTILRSIACASALLASAIAAQAQANTDLSILPAPAGAWRVTVATYGREAELTGNDVVLPAPEGDANKPYLGASARLRDGQREAVLFDWKGYWGAWMNIESRQPLDLRPYLGGTLAFDVDAASLDKGGFKVKMGCGPGCERSVNVRDVVLAKQGQGWQHVALPVRCFVREGADLSKVSLVFGVDTGGIGRASFANVRLTQDALPGLDCPDYRTESVTPAPQREYWAVDWWMPRHEKKLKEKADLLAAGTPPAIVFVGDSITEGWENGGKGVWANAYAPWHALNLGFGGDRTENVLWRLQHGEIDGLHPKVTVLMIGTNNTGFRAEDPQTTAAGVKRIIEEIRQRMPATKVILLPIFPRGAKPDDSGRVLNERVNQIIANYADGQNVFFLDFTKEFLEPDGTLTRDMMPDLLHPQEKGYGIWQRAMDGKLRELMGN